MHSVNLMPNSKLWSIILLAMIIAIGWITPVQAHCAGNHTGNHPHCSGGGEPPATAMKQEIVTVQDSGKQRQKIVVMNADGTDVQLAFEGDRHASFTDVSWSGDGSKVLFHGTVNGRSGIHWVKVFDLDGSGNRLQFAPGVPVFVTATLYSVPQARWSPKQAPDGKEWIAYWDTTEPEWQIWLVDCYSPQQKISLSSVNNRHESHPSWAPDADRIVFLSAPADVQCSWPGDVEILELGVDALGNIEIANKVSLIVDNPSLLTGGIKDHLSETHFFGTDWANNAEWIAIGIPFNSLWVFPTDPLDVELKAKDITNDPELGYLRPAWSPSDNALLFTRESFGGRCNVPDNNDQPQLQGGPSSHVIAALLRNPDPPFEITSLDICNATEPLNWLGHWYEWWRGGAK